MLLVRFFCINISPAGTTEHRKTALSYPERRTFEKVYDKQKKIIC